MSPCDQQHNFEYWYSEEAVDFYRCADCDRIHMELDHEMLEMM